MHRCLQIPEIVILITQSLSYPPQIVIAYPANVRAPDREDARALLSLLLTSKSFLEPCIDALWGCMESAEPLLNLIVPPDRRPSLEDARFPTQASITSLIQAIDGACWSRFHYYADRIRNLTVLRIDPLMGRALSIWMSTHGAPLLRNIRYLDWEEYTVGLYPCIQVFSGPSLTMLKLKVEPWPEECDGLIYPVLASLRTACPSLTALEIDDGDNGIFDGCGRQLSLILAAFPSITRVGFWIEPSNETLLSLATMPNLHTVINRLYVNDVSGPEPASRRLSFPALRVLRWSAPGFKDSTALLSQLQPRPRDLHGLAIHCNDPPTASDLADLLHAIRATCAQQTLTSLALEYAESTPFPSQVALSASSLTAPLCTFNRMQECRLAALPIALDDDILAALAAAWPALRRLELLAAPSASTITLLGLWALADRCPHLEHLEAQVGAWPDDAVCRASSSWTAWTSTRSMPRSRRAARRACGVCSRTLASRWSTRMSRAGSSMPAWTRISLRISSEPDLRRSSLISLLRCLSMSPMVLVTSGWTFSDSARILVPYSVNAEFNGLHRSTGRCTYLRLLLCMLSGGCQNVGCMHDPLAASRRAYSNINIGTAPSTRPMSKFNRTLKR